MSPRTSITKNIPNPTQQEGVPPRARGRGPAASVHFYRPPEAVGGWGIEPEGLRERAWSLQLPNKLGVSWVA